MLDWRTLGILAAFYSGAGAVLTGCAVATPPPAPAAPNVRDDNFLPYREISTSSFELSQRASETVRGHLVARRDKTTGAVTTHAVLGVVYAQRLYRRYEQARNARAEPLSFRSIAHDRSGCRKQVGCTHLELFQVDIPEADLKQAAASGAGYPIKMVEKAGHSTVFPVPKDLVATLVKSLDASSTPAVASKPAL